MKARRICPICGKRPVIYENAIGCSAECDMMARVAIAAGGMIDQMAANGDLEGSDAIDPFEVEPDPFELP